MNKLFLATNRILFNRQKNIVSSAIILSMMLILSRFFGFIRYRVFVNYFSKNELDIFLASFRIPDLIFEILITGALTSSFIPVYMKYQKNQKDLSVNISSIINFIFASMLVFILVLVFLTEGLIPLITPGFSSDKISQVIFYTRILLLGQLPLLILGSVLTALGQANKLFFITAVAPITYNLMIILFTISFAKSLHLDAAILGVISGAFFFFIIQLIVIYKIDFVYQLILERTTGLIEFVRISIPRILSVIIAQIDATIDLSLATILGSGSYTIFYFSQHLQLLPVSIIGMALGQASLPYLSEIYQEKKIDEFKKLVTQSFLNIFYLTAPVAFFFIFARTPLVRIFFGGQRFDWSATVLTAITLSYFSLSIPFHSLYYLLIRIFYSILDTKTPFIVGLFSVLLNSLISLGFVLIFRFPVWSLAAAFSFSITVNCLILIFILQRRFKPLFTSSFCREIAKILFISLNSSFIAYFLLKLIDQLIIDTTRTINLLLLLSSVFIIFVSLYILQSFYFSINEVFLLMKLIKKIKEFPKKIFEVTTQYE
jgi:putative peptidoglycan lipid II flippase